MSLLVYGQRSKGDKTVSVARPPSCDLMSEITTTKKKQIYGQTCLQLGLSCIAAAVDRTGQKDNLTDEFAGSGLSLGLVVRSAVLIIVMTDDLLGPEFEGNRSSKATGPADDLTDVTEDPN